MGEVDYQLALLLQHQFEQELRAPKEYKADVELARTLQEEFQRENDVERPALGLVYDSKRNKTIHNSSKCLTDPSWEVVDPTPDIHMLFIAFNGRFFWNKLLAVCVSWSKRMTTCAGVCSYQGRGGMCIITLSEPLLKLRPRKDLVETLLHEMIHAYLFVTHNNKDRDGHGPEFHKHMYRINGEAGTNITVYHDFHDEVRLYQQHWWRCDGPCQKRKPYFGMVRRAMNRAPGPQDRWWDEHLRNCGGNFIKVKEPDKPEKKSSKASKENKKPKEDIRNFIPPLNKPGTSKNLTNSTQSIASGNIKNAAVLGDTKSLSNVHTVSNATNNDSKISAVIQSKVTNIYGFTNLSGTSSNNLPKQVPSSSNKGNIKGIGKNTSSTITINKKSNSTATTSKSDKLVQPISTITSGPGRTLSESSNINKNLDYSVVRNHWLNKYSNTNTNLNGTKRGLPDDVPNSTGKVPKLLSNPCSSNVTSRDNELGECPVCMRKISILGLNEHIDKCLETPLDDYMKECIICNVKIHVSEYEKHVHKCTEENFSDDVFEVPQVNSSKKCSDCGKNILLEKYSAHVASCSINKLEEKQCDVCEKIIPVTIYDSHIEKCLLQMYDNMEANYGNVEEKIECLACGKSILKSDLGEHLDDCMNMSRVFEDDNEPKEEEPTTSRADNKENSYNCPFCMKLFPEVEMSAHIDECLNIVDCFPRVEKEKCILMESFSSSLSNEDF